MRALNFLVYSCNSQRSGRGNTLLQQVSLRRYPNSGLGRAVECMHIA